MASDAETTNLHKPKERNLAVITPGYNSKSHANGGVPEVVVMKYKCQTNGVPVSSTNGSTIPLVSDSTVEAEIFYNPFEHRRVAHPTTNFETLIHLLKGSLGTGILAMPLAIRNSGIFFGLIATFMIGFICTYCINVLVECSHILSRRLKVPSLSFADVAEHAFLTSTPTLRKWSGFARGMVDLFLCIDLLGCCCVYVVFVAKNVKQVLDVYHYEYDVRVLILALLLPLILLNLIRKLKFLAPFSMVANVLTMAAMCFTFYYIFDDLPSPFVRPAFAEWEKLPLFFGTAIFALEGIGVVMPLENNMKTPESFLGLTGVLNVGMFIVVILYTIFGFFGYLKFGDAIEASITLNLPDNDGLAQSVKLMIALAIFITFSLQFYVPMEIIWKAVKHRFSSKHGLYESLLRSVLVTVTVLIAAAVPNLGPFISLIGAVCLSVLGLILPSVIELVTYHSETGSHSTWRVIKSTLIIAFGIVGFVTGAYSSLDEIIKEHFSSMTNVTTPVGAQTVNATF